jgi:hypothetical protein
MTYDQLSSQLRSVSNRFHNAAKIKIFLLMECDGLAVAFTLATRFSRRLARVIATPQPAQKMFR